MYMHVSIIVMGIKLNMSTTSKKGKSKNLKESPCFPKNKIPSPECPHVSPGHSRGTAKVLKSPLVSQKTKSLPSPERP